MTMVTEANISNIHPQVMVDIHDQLVHADEDSERLINSDDFQATADHFSEQLHLVRFHPGNVVGAPKDAEYLSVVQLASIYLAWANALLPTRDGSTN